jgi:two-component system chemotaxis response regulator CheY
MPKTILIADDNESVRTILKLTLQFKGYALIEVEDGQQAYDILTGTGGVDLLISDIEMPNMNGLELLAKLRNDARFATMPIIVCSAEQHASEEKLIAQGANAFLPKPASPMVLIAKVQELIGE